MSTRGFNEAACEQAEELVVKDSSPQFGTLLQ